MTAHEASTRMTVVGHISPPEGRESPSDVVLAPGFDALGVVAFTTTRQMGSFALQSHEPVADVFGRWTSLAETLAAHAVRLATAHQVHGDTVLVHEGGWTGWLRAPKGDGHIALERGTALAISVADCVPVFIAHPAGATAIVHSGWRGTLANITGRAIERLVASGLSARDLVVHCGPSICGDCYEVSPDVYSQLTGRTVPGPTPVDLRALIAGDAGAAGAADVTISDACTRCHNDRFFSHRCGDEGRQLGVIVRK